MTKSRIYDYVERLSGLLRVDARQAGARHGLQPVQLEVLHYLSICNRFSDTPMAVTEYLGQTKGTVSQTLKVLENKELIVKTADPTDKRVAHMKLTARGADLLQQLLPTPLFRQACDLELSEDERGEIAGALHQLLSALLRANDMKSFGVCHSCRFNRTTDNGSFCELVQQPLSESDIHLICREHE
jgi:MarR family transcriptional regulator, organic hydroperoxide resistance regulator